jgi:hypothetical protein
MKLKFALLCVGSALVLGSSPVLAESIVLQVFKTIDAQEVNCPQQVTVVEQGRPYREGSYTIDGYAKLDKISEKFAIASKDVFSVTWVAKLKQPFIKCRASAGSTENPHLRLRFIDSKIYLILDMTGKRDANQLTPAIVRQAVQDGNPVWSWAGTD